MSATAMVGAGFGGLILLAGLVFLLRRRPGHESESEFMSEPQAGPPVGDSAATKALPDIASPVNQPAGPPVSTAPVSTAGPPVPEGGLPAGWTQEQWEYYGQQYLDGTL